MALCVVAVLLVLANAVMAALAGWAAFAFLLAALNWLYDGWMLAVAWPVVAEYIRNGWMDD